MTISAAEEVKCFVVWSLSFWFQEVIIAGTFWFWCEYKGELSGSKSMDLNSCQWFSAYAEGLKKYLLRGCCCNARAFGVSSHYNDNLNNDKKWYYFRAKGRRDTILLTSRINKISCELRGDGQRRETHWQCWCHIDTREQGLWYWKKEAVKKGKGDRESMRWGGNSLRCCCKKQL